MFLHGDTLRIGIADKGYSVRTAATSLRQIAGLAVAETLRREGSSIPIRPLPRWDNGRCSRTQALHETTGHGFWGLCVLLSFGYSSDQRRERFVKICGDKDVQQLTFAS